MTTKAELFRYMAERAHPKKAKQPPRARRDIGVDTSLPGVSASDRRATKPRNLSVHAGAKAGYALEDSAVGPSRMSTRKSSNRQKTDGQYRMKRRLSESRPRPPSSDAR